MALDPNIGRIKFLRSKTAGRKPTTTDIDEGELALNLVDRTIYTRNGNNIVDIGFGLGGQVNGNITASGTVKATKLEGPLTGNADTATKLQTARAINGVSFDGTSNIVIADSTKLPLTGGSLSGKLTTKPSYLAQNLDDIGAGDNSPLHVPRQTIPFDTTGYIPFVHGSMHTTYSGYTTQISIGGYRGSNTWENSGAYIAVGGNDAAPSEAFMFLNGRKISNTAGPINLVGNASTATKLQTARTIGGVSFDGTANINLPGVNTAGTQSTTGNADTATKLQTGRSINGTNFDGSGNIVTDYWGASRTFSFGNTTKSVNGSGNMTWTLAEMGAFPLVGGTITGNVKINGLLTIDVSNDIGTFKKLIEGLTQTDGGYLAVGNFGADKGYVELGTTDDANTEIYATQRGTTNNIIRRATLLDVNGNTTFPGTVNAASFNGSFTGDMSGNASSATKLQTARLINGETFDGTQNVSIKNIRSLGRKPATDEKTTYPFNTMSYSEVYKNGFPFDYGNAIFIQGGSGTNQLAFEWGAAASGYQRAFLRCVTDISNTWDPWREFAFTNGTIDIAKKLETPRKINGVNFDGTQDITVADSTKLPLTGGNINGNLGVFGRLTSTDVVKGVHFHATGVDNWMPTNQGSWITWNSRAPGQGQFEFVNHQGASAGGFTWYSGNSSNQTALMRLYGDGSLHVTRDVRVDASLNLANNTWNIIGDDVKIGDKNVANKLAIQGTWGPGGVAFFHNDSQVGSIDSVSYTGNAATATSLQTARTINGVSFDGTANITVADGTKLPLAGGSLSGRLTSPSILIDKSSKTASGISWYSSTYTSWQDYMAQAGTTENGVLGNLTAPSGVLVTSWGKRSVIEPSAGYGWTFETVTMSGTTPTIVAEISSTGESRWSGAMTVVGNITATGNITAFSDARLKDNITKIPDALNKLNQLKGVTYTRKDIASDKQYAGLIAQDVQKVLPEAVATTEGDIIAVDYNGVIGLLVEAIKELNNRIDKLERI